MALRQQRYKQAALTYLLYGLIYLGGALYAAETGIALRAMEGSSRWWFLAGAIVTIAFPILIYKQFKWFTRAVVFLLLIRVAGLVKVILGPEASKAVPLPWGGEMPLVVGVIGFMLVALTACIMLARAAWDLPRLSRTVLKRSRDDS